MLTEHISANQNECCERDLTAGDNSAEDDSSLADSMPYNNKSSNIATDGVVGNYEGPSNGVYKDLDSLSQKLAKMQKELFAAVSNAERVEALRQAAELELTRVSLLYKQLQQTCERQQKLLNDASDELRTTKEKYEASFSELVNRWKEAQQSWTERESEFRQELCKVTGKNEMLQDDLYEAQTRLTNSAQHHNELSNTIDRLREELEAVSKEKLQLSEKLNTKLTKEMEASIVLEKYQQLCTQYQLKDSQLGKLQNVLPRVVESAVTKAVETVHSVAKSQLNQASGRLELAEQRLEQQVKRLRDLEIVNQYLKKRLAQYESDGNSLTPQPQGRNKPIRHDSLVQVTPVERTSEKVTTGDDADQAELLIQRWDEEQKWLGEELKRIASKLCQTTPTTECKTEQSTGTSKVRGHSVSGRGFWVPPTPARERGIKRKAGSILRQNIRRIETNSDTPVRQHNEDQPSELKQLIDKINESLESKYHASPVEVSDTLALKEEMEALKYENQRLRKRINQMNSQLSETVAERSRSSSCRPAPRCIRSTDKCCLRKSTVQPMQALEARCFRALSEAEHWRRKWKEQQSVLQIQRERLTALQANQKADDELRQQFLQSVCQLVQQASQHIDHVVQAHINNRISNRPQSTHSTVNKCNVLPDSTKRDRKTHVSSTSVSTPQTSPRKSGLHLAPTGDDRSVRSKELHYSSNKWFEPENRGIQSSSPNGFGMYQHTNCNNNVGFSPSPTSLSPARHSDIVTPPSNSHNSRGMELPAWSEIHQTLAEEFVDQPVTDRTVKCVDEQSEDERSLIDSVATTSDIFEREDSAQKNEEASGENEPFALNDSESKNPSRSMSGSSKVNQGNGQTDLDRWMDLRAAVRYELGRVVSSVLEQAKQITALHVQMTNPPLGPLEPNSDEIMQPLEYLDQWTPAAGEGKCPSTQLFHHVAHATRIHEVSPPIRRDSFVGPAAVQLSVPPPSATPPIQPTVTFSPEIMSEPKVIITPPPSNASTYDTPPNTHPIVQPPTTLQLRSKRTEPPKVVEKARWKTVGGIIHPTPARTMKPTPRQPSRPKRNTVEPISHSVNAVPKMSNESSSVPTSCVTGCLPSLVRYTVGDKNSNVKNGPATIKDLMMEQPKPQPSQGNDPGLAGKPNTTNLSKGVHAHSCVFPPLTNPTAITPKNSYQQHPEVKRSPLLEEHSEGQTAQPMTPRLPSTSPPAVTDRDSLLGEWHPLVDACKAVNRSLNSNPYRMIV